LKAQTEYLNADLEEKVEVDKAELDKALETSVDSNRTYEFQPRSKSQAGTTR